MAQDDFFSSFDDRTRVQRPSPGGHSQSDTLFDNQPQASPSFDATPVKLDLELIGDNPLVAAAVPLLSLVASLGIAHDHADMKGLRQRLVGEIERFNNVLPAHGVPQEQVWKATYAICSLLDETIQKTPWGARGGWAKQSLSILFRRDTWGGEGFFDIIDRFLRLPEQNLSLAELYYLCLSLGFEGKYGKMPNGPGELEKYRTELYQLIQRRRAGMGRELSPRWQGLQDARNPLLRAMPWWVLASVVITALVLMYAGFLFSIDSEPTRQALAKLRSDTIVLAGAVPPPVSPPPHPAQSFQALRDKNTEFVDGNTLRIRNSFEKGSTQVKPEFMPLLQRVAKELVAGQDAVLVTGHTDNVPIHTFSFPSNWELSEARAKNVAKILLDNGVPQNKVEARGRAADEPLVSNDTPDNRALNRRVDILLIR